jgi:hypothetical protein
VKELVNALTDKGNLKSAVQKAVKNQASAHLQELGFALMPNGKFAMPIATASGKVITVNLEMSVGLDTNFEKKAVAKTTSHEPVEPAKVPALF